MVKNNRTLIRFAIIFSFLTFVFMQSCYLFCLFRPDNAVQDTVKQYVEEDLGDVFDEPLPRRIIPELENDFTL